MDISSSECETRDETTPTIVESTSSHPTSQQLGEDAAASNTSFHQNLLSVFESQLQQTVGLVEQMSDVQRKQALDKLQVILQEKATEPTTQQQETSLSTTTTTTAVTETTPTVVKRGRGRPRKQQPQQQQQSPLINHQQQSGRQNAGLKLEVAADKTTTRTKAKSSASEVSGETISVHRKEEVEVNKLIEADYEVTFAIVSEKDADHPMSDVTFSETSSDDVPTTNALTETPGMEIGRTDENEMNDSPEVQEKPPTESGSEEHLDEPALSDNDAASKGQFAKDNIIKKGPKEFQCRICGKIASYRNNIVSHLRIHTGEKPFECSFCHKAFPTSSNLSRHTRETHDKQRPKACGECGQGFFTQVTLDKHMVKKHGYPDNSPQEERPVHKCEECNKTFKTESRLENHFTSAAHNTRVFQCSICKKIFSHQSNLQRHLKIHANKRPHQCELCEKRFIEPRSLRLHVKTAHEGVKPDNPSNGEFACEHCDRQFSNKSTLKLHWLSHTGEKPHMCGTCGKRFSLKANLKRHMLSHEAEKPFQCPTCGKRFMSQRNLNCHEMEHRGERPFVCDQCGKGFTTKGALKEHFPVHHRRREFSCTMCPQTFLRASHLNYHMKCHNKQPDITCKDCGAKFHRQSDLVRHAMKHTGVKPFKCKLCPRTFSRNHYLRDHLKTHQTLYIKCIQCNIMFKDATSYYEHAAIKHSVSTDTTSVMVITEPNSKLDSKVVKILPGQNLIHPSIEFALAKPGEGSEIQPRQEGEEEQPTGKDPLHQAMRAIFDSEEDFASSKNENEEISIQQLTDDVLQQQPLVDVISAQEIKSDAMLTLIPETTDYSETLSSSVVDPSGAVTYIAGPTSPGSHVVIVNDNNQDGVTEAIVGTEEMDEDNPEPLNADVSLVAAEEDRTAVSIQVPITDSALASEIDQTTIRVLSEDGTPQHYLVMPDGSQMRVLLDQEQSDVASVPSEIKLELDGQDESQYLVILNQ